MLLNFVKISLVIGIAMLWACTDPCQDTVCQNGGFCIEGTCHCTFPFQGINCEQRAERLYISVYAGQTICSGLDTNLICIFVADSAITKDSIGIDIKAGELFFVLLNCSPPHEPYATLTARLTNEYSIVFDRQMLNITPPVWFTGTGTLLNSDTLQLDYTLGELNGQGVNYCTVDYIRL